MQINPRTLKYVMTVAEEKSFSRAAEKLYISQPSLSQHISRAEKEVGVQFFNRDVIPLTLTYAGERIVAAAKDFVLLEERLSREMEDITDNKSGRIVVGASATRGAHIIPLLFASYKKKYPQIELKLKEGSNDYLLDLIRNGRADFAFVGYTSHDLESIRLGNDRLLLAVSSENSVAKNYIAQGKKAVDLRVFCEEPFIALHPGQAIRNSSDRIFADYEMNPVIAYETRSFDTAYRMAFSGLGCTFVTSAIQSASGKIALFDLDRGIYPYPLLLVYRKNIYLSQPMQCFIDFSKKIHKQLSVVTHL